VQAGSPGTARDTKTPGGQLVELVLIVGVALVLAFVIQAVLVKPFRIPSESMEPTLDVSQRVLVDRVSFRFSEPHRGDIVVFKPPAGADDDRCGNPNEPGNGSPCEKATPGESDQNFIKRVVAVPGDLISVKDNRVYINGKLQDEPFINKKTPCQELCNLEHAIRVPPDHFFMMGDNRGQSADSREWGPVPKDSIIGNAFLTYWPPRRVGGL
jgi:signal peptidase I